MASSTTNLQSTSLSFPKLPSQSNATTENIDMPTNEETNTCSTAESLSHSNVTAQSNDIKEENAIIIDSMDGLTVDDYLDGLEQLIDVTNVRSISKISGNRVCTYLNERKYVELLTNKTCAIKTYTLKVRPLVSGNMRIVISNIHTVIPNRVILAAMASKGITVISSISEIRASSQKPGRSHIMSFRRAFYIKEEELHILPEKLQLTHGDATHGIYLTADQGACYICKQMGHLSRACSKNLSSQPNTVHKQEVAGSVQMGSNELGNINHNTSNDSSLSPQLAKAKRVLPNTNETSADSSTTSTTTSPGTVSNNPFPPLSFTIVHNKSTKRRKRREVDTTQTDGTKRLITNQALAPIESCFEESQKSFR
ncbi:hypothetical protein QAD02_010044 [Eretmocerus hayati]|uniref:Uncharacterized protein n=1 Tax=Eretmocerus hayati TaxID=131215 RepID=A0ACC2NCD5_9HYME|nr:hypothetical protein QAD02_010044 [Eretmocerus hayati]